MNGKRWVAIGMAMILLILSAMIKTVINPMDQGTGFVQSLLLDGMSEKVLHSGEKSHRIAVLYVDGVIRSTSTSGLFHIEGYDHDFLLRQIDKIMEDMTVEGVILSVNSPGGGTFESSQLKDALRHLQQTRKIPIYVSMQNIAASGGYYISAYADKIFASEETLTGSIGVIMSGLNLSGLYEKLGIVSDTIKSGEFKDIGSEARPMTEADKKILQDMIDSSYERFLKVVSEGRKMDMNQARALADGRIYDGRQAKEKGLVDEVGYFEDAVRAMRTEHSLQDGEVFFYENDKTHLSHWFNMKFGRFFTTKKSEMSLLSGLLMYEKENYIRPMYIYRGGLYE